MEKVRAEDLHESQCEGFRGIHNTLAILVEVTETITVLQKEAWTNGTVML